ncbi:MAG: butyrate kinase [Oscillospiraceae bacterium]|nr:butyrate kinase [Oscillospiraceae bacterium]
MAQLQLIINPGSTSTKLALYDGAEKLVQQSVEHKPEELLQFENIADQVPYRLGLIRKFMEDNHIDGSKLSAVVGRGGLVFGLKTGGYLVDDLLCRALTDRELSQPHASNLGGLLARELSKEYHVPAYIYDAVTSGELSPVARITGMKEILRRSFCHVLNSRAQAIRYAQSIGKKYEDLNLIVVHLGGGTSASVHQKGSIVDSVGDDDGQFSPERSGCFPSLEIVRLCFSGKYTKAEMDKKIRGKGGMYSHLGTSDCRVIEKMIEDGDKHADLILQAQAYQIAKTIGLLSIVLKGDCDAIILTGGMAHSKMLTQRIKDYVEFLAPVVVMPGENEMEALAQGGLRLITGQEKARVYQIPSKEEQA